MITGHPPPWAYKPLISLNLRFSELVECVEQQLHGRLIVRVLHIMPSHSEHNYRTTFRVISTLEVEGREGERERVR